MTARRIAAATLLVVMLAGCSAGGTGAPPTDPAPPVPGSAAPTGDPSIDERFTPDIPAELRVANPKDARGVHACDLLTAEQLTEVGLDAQSAAPDVARNGPICSWRHIDGSTRASVALAVRPDGAKLPDLYRVRSTFENFQMSEVAGHPALRADDVPVGDCTLNVAVADDQIITIHGYLDGRELPEPCAMAREMAELILSNLPPKS